MRRVKTTFALVAAAALAATGCAGDEQTVQTGAPAEEQPAQQTPFEERAQAIAAQWPEKLDPIGGRDGELLPVENIITPDSDSTELTVTVGHGQCDADYGARVDEIGELIVVSGWAKKDENVDFCTEQLVTDEVTVSLKEKFDDRTVVDAATGESPATKEKEEK